LASELACLVDRFSRLNLELLAGRRVFEVKLPGFDKGQAIERFMAHPPFVGRRPVFIADDEIDQVGVEATLALDGLAFSVGRALPGVAGCFTGPAAVRDWIASCANG
jgi:trehalose 6-phosphate phosphatase